MNNEQFRRLVGGNTPKPTADDNNESTPARSLALGSRQKSSIPMTPRSVGFSRTDFQRQLAERNQTDKPQKKKYRTSAPKGSKLAAGYVDRTKAREDEDADSRAVRIKALEESLKKEEIDQETFDRLRFEIAGGDLSSTHLVKGLDFRLLERVRKGEDVYGKTEDEPDSDKEEDDEEEAAEAEDVDEAFEELESTNIEAIAREKEAKKGQFATGGLKPGQKRTRDMILAELKAARDAAKAKNKSALGDKFKKIGDKPAPGSSRIERDSKGREVLIVVDEDGHEKRKIRKIQPQDQAKAEAELEAKAREAMMPDKDAKPLGMEVPDIYKPKPEEEDEKEVDIFDDVGDDYDPLAGLGDDSDEDSDEDEGEITKDTATPSERVDRAAMPPPPRPATTSEPRNYFKDAKTKLVSSETIQAPSMSDPAIAAAFKRAASLKAIPKPSDEDDGEARAKAERHRKMLQNVDRDAEDMDMGFGMSRFEDEADLDDSKVELSEWGNEGDDKDGKEGGDGKAKRKRGGKKRKGDANSVADVMRVMEQRKTAGK
ncbi:inosine-uridine preferring nucleoside hydrolase-domain-containing protein [Apiospora sp. TS-2023a]